MLRLYVWGLLTVRGGKQPVVISRQICTDLRLMKIEEFSAQLEAMPLQSLFLGATGLVSRATGGKCGKEVYKLYFPRG